MKLFSFDHLFNWGTMHYTYSITYVNCLWYESFLVSILTLHSSRCHISRAISIEWTAAWTEVHSHVGSDCLTCSRGWSSSSSTRWIK
jgi:hypothetical protein